MPQQVIFYSWQSWTDPASHRNLIEHCLEQAVRELRKDDSLKLDPVIDRDTLGVSGSPDIAGTILEKIRAADVFVADVSFVDEGGRPGRRVPNPNVSVELGYALGVLGPERVVCVFNAANGDVESLPFDVRGRRVMTYRLGSRPAEEDQAWIEARAAQRRSLTAALKAEITSALSVADPATTRFLSDLAGALSNLIIFGSEAEDRPVKPGSEAMRRALEQTAVELRRSASRESATRLGVDSSIREVADAAESAIVFSRNLGSENRQRYLELIHRAVSLASELKRTWIDTNPPSRETLRTIQTRLREMRAFLGDAALRLKNDATHARFDEAETTANKVGLELCQIGLINLDGIQPGISSRLQELGRNLHLVGVSIRYRGGVGRRAMAILEDVVRLSEEFGQLVDALPRER